jgi:hypothetical protein
MKNGTHVWRLAALAGILYLRAAAVVAASPAAAVANSAHDFDFLAGHWSAHISHVVDPLVDGQTIVELDGTIDVGEIWQGRGWLEQVDVRGLGTHWGGLALFLYNSKVRQWSQSFVNRESGERAAPMIGEFRNGQGLLYSQDTYHDRTVLVRGVWSDIEPNSHLYTESLSDDGGVTWKPALIVHWIRRQN